MTGARLAPTRALALALGLATGCEAVPVLTFEVDAGPGDDAAAAPEDAGADAGCPESPPSGASVCCGPVACDGLCASQCAACAAKCTPDQLCCAKTNNVVCMAAGSICH